VIENEGSTALNLTNANIGGDLILPVTAKGAVIASRAEVRGNVRTKGFGIALLNSEGVALDLQSTDIKGTFEWIDIKLEGQLDLGQARAAQLNDKFESWPTGRFRLDGFQYSTLGDAAVKWTVDQRRDWLASQADNRGLVQTQPYQHLVGILRALGRDAEAREIAIAGRRRVGAGQAFWPSRIWSSFLHRTIAYGYKPWRVALPSFAFVIIGWLIFELADRQGLMIPAMGWAYNYQSTNTILELKFNATSAVGTPSELTSPQVYVKKEYPRFLAAVYSLDTFLPIVDLRQKSYWVPRPLTPFGWFALAYLWFQTLAGWILTTTLVAALSGLIKKE
jgi:hypothetical protein